MTNYEKYFSTPEKIAEVLIAGVEGSPCDFLKEAILTKSEFCIECKKTYAVKDCKICIPNWMAEEAEEGEVRAVENID